MPIINRGVFDLNTVYLREVGNDWPTAQVLYTQDVLETAGNLYYTDARVNVAVRPMLTTANVVEVGENSYFTNARTVAVVTPLLTTANVVETSGNLYFTNARVLAAITNTNLSLNNLTLIGDLEVQGNVVTLNTGILTVEDKDITLANGAINASQADGAGIRVAGARANIVYEVAGDDWAFNKDIIVTGNIIGTANTVVQNILTDRITSNSWSRLFTANVVETSDNLYFTNARVLASLVNANVLVADLRAAGNLVANGLVIRGINVTDSVLTGNITITNITNANVVSANIISSQIWQNLYSGNIIENTNLFFSNARARGAFIAGRGIIIMDDGTIKSTIGTENFNTAINLNGGYVITANLATAIAIPASPTVDRYLVRSMHLTNISDNPAFVSANILYATGNTATLANLFPVPVGGILEFMDRIQILQPGDRINMQGFNGVGVPTSNVLAVNFALEQINNDTTYYGTAFTLANSNVEVALVQTPQSYAILESAKFVNLTGASVPIRLYTKNANNIIDGYFAFNTQVPPNSSLEVLQAPKNIEFRDTLFAMYTGTSAQNAIAVFPSYRYSSVTTLGVSTAAAIPGDNVIISFATSITDGTTLFYTLEE